MFSKSILALNILFLFFSPLSSFGQIKDDVVTMSYSLTVPDFGDISTTSVREVVVKGTPYMDKVFKSGKIIIGDSTKNEKDVLMRFNAYRDQVEINQNGKKAFVAQASNVKVVLDGKTYCYLKYIDKGNSNTGYFNPLNEGETKLFAKTRKVIPKIEFPENGYEDFERPSFITETTYYIKRKNRAAQKLRHFSRKEVFAILWDKYSELRDYARKNKLSVRNLEDTLQILTYYDQIQESTKADDIDK